MADTPGQSDIDIKVALKTVADNTGIQETQAALDRLKTTAGGSSTGTLQPAGATPAPSVATPTPQGSTDPVITEHKVTEAVKQRARVTQDAAREAIKGEQAQADAVQATTQAVDEQAARVKALKEEITAAKDRLANNETALSKQLDDIKSKEQALANTTVAGNNKILQSIQWLQTGWAKAAQMAAGMFGAIGLVTQGINLARAAWDWYNKDAIEADNRRKAALEQQAATAAELRKTYMEAAREQRNADRQATRQYDEERRLDTYKREVQAIQSVNNELIRQAQLKAALDNNAAEATRIRLEQLKYEGNASQADLDKLAADRQLQDRNNQRDVSLSQAQAKYDDAWANEDNIGRQLKGKIEDRDSLTQDPRYMQSDDYNSAMQQIQDMSGLINGLSTQWHKEADVLRGIQRMTANYEAQTGFVPQSLRDEEKIKKDQAAESWNKIEKIKKDKKIIENKTKSMDQLVSENGLKSISDLAQKIKGCDQEIQSLATSLDAAQKLTAAEKNALEDLQKIQSGERANDEQEHNNQLARINKEARKQQLDDSKAASEQLKQDNEAIAASWKSLSSQLQASRQDLAKQTSDIAAGNTMSPQGKTMTDRIQLIAGKTELGAADETELLRYKAALESSGSKGTAASKQLQSVLNQLIKNFDTERLAKERAAESVRTNLGKIRGLDHKAAGDQARQDTTDVETLVKAELARNISADGTHDSREDQAARTIALIRRALEDNLIGGKERSALVSELQGWLADINTWGEDSVNGPLRDLLRQMISGYGEARKDISRTVATVREMQRDYATAKLRADNQSS